MKPKEKMKERRGITKFKTGQFQERAEDNRLLFKEKLTHQGPLRGSVAVKPRLPARPLKRIPRSPHVDSCGFQTRGSEIGPSLQGIGGTTVQAPRACRTSTAVFPESLGRPLSANANKQ